MKIFVADKFEQAGIDQMQQFGCEVTYAPGTQGQHLIDAVVETACNILIVRSTKVPREVMAAGNHLEMVLRAGAGTDTIDVPAATELGIKVCNCPGMNSVAVAELTIGFMIALDRRIVDETDDLRRRVWNKKEYSKARGLKGRTLGIIGLGRIGCEVAKRAAAFEMNIVYTDVAERYDLHEKYGLHKVSLEQLLAESDFITVHVPGGKDTRHMIGVNEFARMKSGAFVINCSRGGVVDETALADAVKAGRVAGAALDVYEVEPEAPQGEFKDPILTTPHVYGTHHVGASTEQAQAAVAEETVRIVRAFVEDGEVTNCVNPAGALMRA
ncbi:MAG: hydroxyacid dehydrogenase [Planctomycetes bacterium]|nr:hydroxyacid dehydrogenase [Planctomycetota bacterium]